MKQFLVLYCFLLSSLSFLHAQGDDAFKPIARGFSVYILPAQSPAESTSDVASDLFFDFQGKNVPLDIRPGTQSILYPLPPQEKLTLFKVSAGEKGEIRIPIATTPIPESAARGILILMPSKNKLKITPYWFEPSDLRGAVLFHSLLKEPAGLVFHRKDKVTIKPGMRANAEGKFTQGSSIGMINTQLFTQHPRKKTWDITKEITIHVRKKQGAIALLYQRTKNSYSFLSLGSEGIPNFRKQVDLGKILPQFGKTKQNDASEEERPAGI